MSTVTSNTVRPEQFNRRSFVYTRLVAAGATFRDIGDAALAVEFPEPPPPLGLAALSPIARIGVKGPRALTWLAEQGWAVPAANNTALITDEGPINVRLADTEALILGSAGSGKAIAELEGAIPGAGVWSAPRRDSHCWFRLQGDASVDCLQKLCGVDLRVHHFPAGTVAQTSVARLNTILIRDEGNAFHLLADSASAVWFWDALLDAMAEFDGAPVGA